MCLLCVCDHLHRCSLFSVRCPHCLPFLFPIAVLIDDDIEHGKSVGGEGFNLLKKIPLQFIEKRPLRNMDGDTGEGAEVRTACFSDPSLSLISCLIFLLRLTFILSLCCTHLRLCYCQVSPVWNMVTVTGTTDSAKATPTPTATGKAIADWQYVLNDAAETLTHELQHHAAAVAPPKSHR